MKTGSSEWHLGQIMCSAGESGITRSAVHARHLKFMIRLMRPLFVMLLMALVVQAQSIADVARKERERQANLTPSRVITSVESVQAAEPAAAEGTEAKAPEEKAAAKETVPQPATPTAEPTPAVDPLQVWTKQLDQLRARIRSLQDQETALLLQLNQANNQVYAPVTDPATQQRALAQVGEIQQQLAAVRTELEAVRKTLDSVQMQGPAKQ